MKTYLFARYLPADWRRAILQARYEPKDLASPQYLADGAYCPLGVPHRDGLVDWAYQPSAPDGLAVVAELSHRRCLDDDFMDDAELQAVIDSVNQFTDDWDQGRITPADLPAIFALGVPG